MFVSDTDAQLGLGTLDVLQVAEGLGGPPGSFCR